MKPNFNLNRICDDDIVIAVEEPLCEKKTTNSMPGTIPRSGERIVDPRSYITPIKMPDPETIIYYSYPKIGSMMRYGQAIRNGIQLGAGWSSEVVDYGDAISVKITYTNINTSLSASQNFIILFNNIKGQCVVKPNSQRYKTCNSPDQAVSYIRSKASALPGKTNSIN